MANKYTGTNMRLITSSEPPHGPILVKSTEKDSSQSIAYSKIGGASSNFLTPQVGTSLIFSDPCTANNPIPIWAAWVGRRTDNQLNKFTGDYALISGSALSRTAGAGPGGVDKRTITVRPVDVNWSAARCALGYNWNSTSDDGWPCFPKPGPTVLWHEGQYRMLHLWLRLGAINNTGYFRQLFEIKQSEPNTGGNRVGFPIELQQRNDGAGPIWLAGFWWDDSISWRIPVTQSVGDWIPFSVEGFWSMNPSLGWMRIKIGNQISPVFHQQTLLQDDNGSVPGFLELGPYQDVSLPQFTVDYADIKVYG